MNTQCMQTRQGSHGALLSSAGLSRSGTATSLKGLYAAAAGTVSRFMAGFAEARRRRAAVRELSSLSDRQLADIGISRHQIGEVVGGLMRSARQCSSRADV